MKFYCDKNELQTAINIVLKAVPPKSPITSIEGILFQIEKNKLKLTGYDLKKAIYTYIDSDVIEDGMCCINARFFSEMIRRLGDGTIYIECNDDNSINVKCGKSEYNFIGLELNEYPEIPTFNENQSIEIKQNMLKDMIDKTIFAVSKEEVRPVYTGSLFEIEDGEFNIVSIDGYRLARRTEIIENKEISCSFIVPGNALADVTKICTDNENEKAVISIGTKHISFKIGETVVITRRLEGEFINHRKSIPESFKSIIKVERQELISSIDRVSLMQSEKNENPVKMTFEDGLINCRCKTPLGKAEDVCTCIGNADDLEIGFNSRYILEALKATDEEIINLCLNTSSSPCVIKPSDNTDKFTYMILPVRLHA